MDDNIWKNIDLEEIKPQELTESEKKIAEECANLELEFEEAISLISSYEEE